MKTVGMITFHSACNYGAILQTTALYHCLKYNMNTEPVVVDYTPWSITFADFVRFFPVSTNPGDVFSGLLTFKERWRKIKSFRQFAAANLRMTEKYNSKWKLYASPPKVNIHLCGSDQIWNPHLTFGICTPMYLDYAETIHSVKASYAASLGLSRLPESAREKISQLISGLDHISMREESGRSIVKDLTARSSECNVDPTLLLTREDWDAYTQNPPVSKPYILVYKMQNNSMIYNTAATLKESYGLPLLEISRYGAKQRGVDIGITDAGPGEFLGLIKNAEYVLTNSYHGLLFSIIYGRPCLFHSGARWNDRGRHVLDLLGHSDKIITDQIIGAKDISNYLIERTELTDQKINMEMRRSLDYLRTVIEG